jgi:hypothetical protein
MSPLAFVQSLAYATVAGELDTIREHSKTVLSMHVLSDVVINAALAFFLVSQKPSGRVLN